MLSSGLKWTSSSLVLIVLLVVAQVAQAQQPVVTSFSPLLGPPGTAVTLTGTNFNTTPANNIVFFGATRVNVSNATPTQLNVFVPLGASYDYISVQNTANGLIGLSTVKYSPTRATGSGPIIAGQFEPYKNFPDNNTGGGTRAVVNHDLDGDGKPDMTIVSDASNSIAILRNTSVAGQLSFAPKIVYPTGEFPTHASIGDLDGDSKPDIVVVARGNTDPNSKTITVYRNTSTVGSISFLQVLQVSTLVYALAPLADVDRDGKLDIIAPTGEDWVKILRNESTPGNIVFAVPQQITFPSAPISGATITDLDGDGIPDMVAVNTGSGSLYTLRNLSTPGTISFEAPVAHPGSFSTTFVIASGDLDQDGRPDIAVVDYNFGQSLNVLKNTSTVGNISFNTRVQFTMPDWYAYQTMMGDINADGKLDIVVSNERDEIVSVFENTTTPGVIDASSFAARVDIPVAGTWHHFGASLTDLDLDGRLDISVTTDYYVSVLRFDETYVPSFLTTWKTDVTGAGTITGTNQIRLPVAGGPYQVKWVEAGNPLNNGILSGLNNAQTITFPTPGIYRVSISGSINSFIFNSGGDRNKLLTVEHWGPTAWTSMQGAFAGCENMNVTAIDAPDLSNVTSTARMFADAHSFNAPVNHWDVSHVTNMAGMFNWATEFNQELYNWDVSNVTNMSRMFSSAESFDQYIDNWNTVSVTDMSEMFSFAKVFNQSLNNWNVGAVTTMQDMFYFAEEFNQPLENWNVSSVTNMSRMFMLTKFNQPIGNWDVGNVTNMNQLFSYCATFNQDLNSWDVSNVTDMSDMFIYANTFNSNIGSWDVSNVTNMSRMFHQTAFNQNISGWDVSSVTNMSQMFRQDFDFNQDISGWDVSAVTNMASMFEDAGSFNQDLGSWNVSNVTNMTNIFNNPFASFGISRQNYDNTLLGWAALSTLQPNVPVGALNRYYCTAEGARNTLISTHGWTFTGDFRFCPAPVITSFTPISGLTGAEVTITGTDFTGTTDVFFGTTAATSFTVVNATTITAIVGTGSSGAIYVSTPEGGDFSTDSFTFYGQPIIESFTPTSAGANAMVTITGTYFTDATSVTFGGVPAKSYQIISETTITAATGSGASGSVEVTAPGGTGSLSGFTFTAPANPPVISATQLSTRIEGMITLDLVPLITTSGSPLDLSSLKVLTQPESGAQATIDANGILTINYAGRRFSGTDAITIEACDLDGNCASQAFTIEVADDLIVYNGVSPGGTNPEFIIEHIELLADTKKNTVTIFDRWQNEVWSGSNYDNTSVVFNGVSDSGKELPSGVYFYRIDFSSSRKRQSGFISIRR